MAGFAFSAVSVVSSDCKERAREKNISHRVHRVHRILAPKRKNYSAVKITG